MENLKEDRYMAGLRNTGSNPESVEEWENYFMNSLKVTKEVACNYASALVNNGYCWETVKLVVQNTPTAQPCQSLLEMGFKEGHCLKMAMFLKSNEQPSEIPINNTSGSQLKKSQDLCSFQTDSVLQNHEGEQMKSLKKVFKRKSAISQACDGFDGKSKRVRLHSGKIF